MAKRAQTAYFAFSEEMRGKVKEELVAKSDSGKVSVAEVAKEIGRLWKELAEDERQGYKDRAAESAKVFAEVAAAANDGKEPSDEPAEHAAKKPAQLPLSIVKKVMVIDKDVSRVTAEGVWLMARAAEAFLEELAERCAAAALGKKRRTIKMDDFEHVVRRDKKLVEVGLKGALHSSPQGETDKENAQPAEGGDDAAVPEPKRQKKDTKAAKKVEVDVKARKITSFFTKSAVQPAKAAADSEAAS